MDYKWPKEFDELATEARLWVKEATSDLFNTDDGWLVGYSDEFTLRLADKGWIGMTWPIDKGGCLLYTSPSPRDATLSR